MRWWNSEIVNGVEVGRGWGTVLRRSQRNHRYVIGGKPMERVRFAGDTAGNPPAPPCRECAAAPGQFHVPGCGVEVCPRCRGQAIWCGCFCPFKVPFSPFYVAGEEVEE